MVVLRFFGLLTLLTALAVGAKDSDSVGYPIPIPRNMNQVDFSRSIIDYWTSQRRTNAKPKDEIALGTSGWYQSVRRSSNDLPRSTPSVAPSIKIDATGSARSTGTLTPPPMIGKVFFVMNGADYVCSASVVTATNRNTVLTAGHCVYNTNTKKWATKFLFVPAYSNGLSRYGSWTAHHFAALNGWMNNHDHNYDVAIAAMNTNSRGQHIQDVTGALGMTANWPKEATVYAFGYPVSLSGGKLMSRCMSNSSTVSFVSGFDGIKLPCGMTAGASGGPWIQNFNTTTLQGRQTSVNSFFMPSHPGYMFGPYFNTDIWNFFKSHENA
ncbi:unnamed protein product [Rotaria sp. Silwood2]|nr:unnamed protein product [Rotaria sp. Silwood2]CAF2628542.1 unnamed protein product [Rotaria sp. Silwood2]CAF2838611.1 unnamed protein product [Rotaria sp. Silwood2]CAF2996796.1 unnamed protein product [Rotaria sp. Silwood2]CAF4082926.1 unnamed protein product [Rotaria sp. Silwood2]